MNTLDIILCIFLVIGFIRGFFKGFFLELAGIVALIVGVYGAIHFSPTTHRFLSSFLSWDPEVLSLVSLAFTFIIIVLIVSLIGSILTKMASLVALGLVNRLLGAVFGFLKMAFFASLIFMFISYTDAFSFEDDTKSDSILYSPVEALAPRVLPTILRKLDEGDYFEAPSESDSERTQENGI